MEVEFQVLEKSFHNSETNAVLSTFDLSFVSVRPDTNKEEEYKCVECGMSFVTTRLLFQNHLLMHQSGQIPKKTKRKYTKKTVKPGPAVVVNKGSLPRKETKPAAIGKENNLLLKGIECNGDDVDDKGGMEVDGENSAVSSIHCNDVSNANMCEQCGKVFTTIGGLNLHLSVQHDDLKALTFRCETCGKSFANQVKLSAHMRSHVGRDFICKLCRKGFKRAHHLKGHFTTHGVNKEGIIMMIEQAIKEAKIKNGKEVKIKGKNKSNGKEEKGKNKSNGKEEKGKNKKNGKEEKGKNKKNGKEEKGGDENNGKEENGGDENNGKEEKGKNKNNGKEEKGGDKNNGKGENGGDENNGKEEKGGDENNGKEEKGGDKNNGKEENGGDNNNGKEEKGGDNNNGK